MGDEFDDLGLELEPRTRRARRIVMGEGGSEEGARVEEGREFDADAPLPPVPAHADEKGPASGPTAQQAEWWEDRETDRELGEHSAIGDVARTALGAVPGAESVDPGITAARQRTSQRLGRAGEEWLDAATIADRAPDQSSGLDRRAEALPAGMADTALLGWADELGGAASATARGTDYEQERDRIREQTDEAREQSPSQYGAGQALGTLPWLAAPNPATGAGRVALGAAMGGLDAAGHSEDTGAQLATDTAQGAALGAGMGLLGEGALALARGPGEGAVRQRALEEMRDAADDQLLAATGHAGNNAAAVRAFDFGDSRQAIRESRRRAAQVLRETGAVPAAAGIRGTRRSIEDAYRASTGAMDDVRTAMGSAGPTGVEVAERLRGRASSMDAPTAAPIRDVLDDFAERFGGVEEVIPGSTGTRRVPVDPRDRHPEQPIDYKALIEQAGHLRGMGAWRTRAGRDVPLTEEGRRLVDREMRSAYDDALEAQASRAASEGGAFRSIDLTPEQRAALARLGEDPVGAYRQARRRYAVLEDALGNAQRGEEAVAGNRGVGMSEMQWGGAGMSAGATIGAGLAGPVGAGIGAPLGAAAGAGLARGWRGIEPRVRARYAQELAALAERWPELSQETLGTSRRALGGLRIGTGESADEIVLDDPQPAPPVEAQPAAEPEAEDPFADLDLEYDEE